jgi:hypothetical protein
VFCKEINTRLREKDGKLRLVCAGWDDVKVVQPDGCGQARREWTPSFLTRAGWDSHPLESAALSRRTGKPDIEPDIAE